MRSDVFPYWVFKVAKSNQSACAIPCRLYLLPIMDKEKRITRLISDMRKENRVVTAKTVVIASILSKGSAINISDKELIQSIINKTKGS